MKLRTSFCNISVIKKNITRFAPVWGLYTIFLLIGLFTMARRGYPAILARDGVESINAMALVNIVYGFICAAVLFGDLFIGRLCNALHALPVRRETWLGSHIISGILFSLIPNTLVTVLASFLMMQYAYIAWIWLAASMLQFVFFFGTGVLSAVCAGNRLGMMAIYGIIHFITLLVYVVVVLIYQPLMYGVLLNFEKWRQFFPLLHMVDGTRMYVNFIYYPTTIEFQFQGFPGSGWLYLALCAAAGFLSVISAYFIYRCRNLEYSGDFIALKPIAPVFLVIYSIGVGAVLYSFSEIFENSSYVYLAVGLTIGFFTGLMLLERTVKVFSKRSILSFAVLVAVLACSMWITWLDPFGLTTKMPDKNEVEWGAAYSADQEFVYTQDERNPYCFRIADPDEMDSLQQFHKKLTADKKISTEEGTVPVRIQYKLTDGEDVIRYYRVDPQTELGKLARARLSDMRYLFQVDDIEMLYDMFSFVSVECYDMNLGDDWKIDSELGGTEQISLSDKMQIRELLDAIRKDAESGYMAQQSQFHEGERYLFYISFEGIPTKEIEYKDWKGTLSSQSVYYCGLSIYEGCFHTINYLENLYSAGKLSFN